MVYVFQGIIELLVSLANIRIPRQ